MSSDRAPESLVSIWQDQATSGFRMVPVDFAKRMRKEVRNWQRSTWGGVALFMVSALFGVAAVLGEADPLQQLGLLLMVLTFVFFSGQIVVHVRRLRAARFSIDRTTAPSLASARTYLELRRDFHRGSWLWSRVIVVYPLIPVRVYASARNDSDAIVIMAVTLLLWTALMALIVFGVQRRAAKGFERQLRELDDIERLSPVERYLATHEPWK